MSAPVRVTVRPLSLQLKVGDSAKVTPSLFDIDGQECEAKLSFDYRVRNSQLVKIEPEGTITGIAPGIAEIEIHYPHGGQTGPNPSTIYTRTPAIVIVSR